MTDYTANANGPAFAIQVSAGRLGARITRLVDAVSAWNDARVTRNALSALSDRELEDIGLVRGDIDLVSTGRRAA